MNTLPPSPTHASNETSKVEEVARRSDYAEALEACRVLRHKLLTTEKDSVNDVALLRFVEQELTHIQALRSGVADLKQRFDVELHQQTAELQSANELLKKRILELEQ